MPGQRSATPNTAATAHTSPFAPTPRTPAIAPFDVEAGAEPADVGDTVIVVTPPPFVFVAGALVADVVSAAWVVGDASVDDVVLSVAPEEESVVDADAESVAVEVAFAETKMVGEADANAPEPDRAGVGWETVEAAMAVDTNAAKLFGAEDGGALITLCGEGRST